MSEETREWRAKTYRKMEASLQVALVGADGSQTALDIATYIEAAIAHERAEVVERCTKPVAGEVDATPWVKVDATPWVKVDGDVTGRFDRELVQRVHDQIAEASKRAGSVVFTADMVESLMRRAVAAEREANSKHLEAMANRTATYLPADEAVVATRALKEAADQIRAAKGAPKGDEAPRTRVSVEREHVLTHYERCAQEVERVALAHGAGPTREALYLAVNRIRALGKLQP